MAPGRPSAADKIALDRKVRSSIRGIMGWDAQEFKDAMSSLAVRERRAFKNDYAAICADMQQLNVQWSTNLMLESVDIGKKRSYVAAYPSDTAPRELTRIGELRMEFLGRLYSKLPAQESEMYGELLSPVYPNRGSLPDPRALYVLGKLQDALKLARLISEGLAIRPSPHRARRLELAPGRATRWHQHFFEQTLGAHQPNDDSLYARLMLNACANNFRLQGAEIEWLRAQACTGMTKLVHHLRAVFGGTLPEVHSEGDVRQVLFDAMKVPGQQPWRSPKEKASVRILSRAMSLADTERHISENPEAEPFKWKYVLLTNLAVAWSYCSYELHDSCLVGEEHRVRQLMSGRADPLERAPSIDLYHRQQFALLWQSEQAFRLDARQIAANASRTSLMFKSFDNQLVRLKAASLAQWHKLGMVLSRELAGTDWDQEPHPVTSSTA